MSGTAADVRSDAWGQRPLPLVTVVPYVLLAILVGYTAVAKRSDGESLLIDLALSACAAGWMLWMVTLHPAWREHPRVMALFMAVLIAIMAVLVIRDPWFGFFAPAAYFYAFRVLPWPWRLAGIAGVAVLAGTAQVSNVPKTYPFGVLIYVASVAVNVLPLCGLAWVLSNDRKHNDLREQALKEVSTAKLRLEATLAENTGLHQQLMIQAREAGVLDERQRMAREIHDTLAQGLTGIITQLQAAEQASEDPAGWRRHFEAATMLARESLSEARRSVDALRPEPLEMGRLSEALAAVTERWSALYDIAAQITATGVAQPMRPEVEVALLRTLQEALANVAKHAQATRVGVTLSYMDGEVALDVRDDGRGFDPARIGIDVARTAPALAGSLPGTAASQRSGEYKNGASLANAGGGGFGLVAMRQRIEGVSGTLQVESEAGVGTAISACVPAVPAGERA